MEYGREEVQRLSNWFTVALERAGCNTKNINEQWVFLKIQVNSQFRKLDYANLWQTFLTKVPYKEDFKDVLHLVEILLVLPISVIPESDQEQYQSKSKCIGTRGLDLSIIQGSIHD